MNKLTISYIGDNCTDFLDTSFESIIDIAEKIIFIWGMKDKNTKEKLLEWKQKYPNKFIIIESKYDDEDKRQNGKQRNLYLDYLKKNYNGEWNLTLDPDECVSNPQNIKPIIEQLEKTFSEQKNIIINPHMRHLITYIDYEDSTLPIHYCPGRFFKVTDDLYYPETEHPVLQCKKEHIRNDLIGFTIWHLAYIPYVFSIRKRYLNHIKKSEMHTRRQLDNWYYDHISGFYSKRKFDINELPKQVKEYFMLYELNDFIYFREGMKLELKHWQDCFFWKEYFKPTKVLFIGCGNAHRVYTMNNFGVESYGCDINKYVIENTLYPHLKDKLRIVDITKFIPFLNDFDLVIIYDVLEHLQEKDLQHALKNIYDTGTKNYLFSICFKDNPDYQYDNTHKTCQYKEWWVEKLQNIGFKIKPTPQHFLYANQIIVAEK